MLTVKNVRLAKMNDCLDEWRDRAIEALIAERYSLSKELSVQRQRDTNPRKFSEYFSFVERCKQTVDEFIEKVLSEEV